MATNLIEPEYLVERPPGYAVGHWDYAARCGDVDLALKVVREQIEEWDRHADPHGWWHTRPHLITLYNEVVRIRGE